MVNNRKSRIKYVATVGMLCALCYVIVVTCRIPVVMFLKYEPKDVLITLGGLIWGPLTSCIVSVIVSLLEMVTVSDTGIWGCIMNILSTCTFACTAAFIYKKKHTLWGAILGLITGAAATVGVMLLWNYLITPIYMGYPREAVADLLLPVFLPFNVIKCGLNAAFTFLLYKPVMTALRGIGIVDSAPPEKQKKSPLSIGTLLVAAVVVITGILLILVMNGTI